MSNVALYYYCGKGTEQNFKEAFKWYKKSAEGGDAGSMNCIGVMYKSGQGIAKDYEKAIEWFNKAIKAGDNIAKYNLGNCYFLA